MAITHAESGSPLEVVLVLYGAAEAALLWNPLQVALTLRPLSETYSICVATQIDALVASLQVADPRGSHLRELYAEFESTQADGCSAAEVIR